MRVGWFFCEVSVDLLPTNRAGRTTFVNDGRFHQGTHTSIVDDDPMKTSGIVLLPGVTEQLERLQGIHEARALHQQPAPSSTLHFALPFH